MNSRLLREVWLARGMGQLEQEHRTSELHWRLRLTGRSFLLLGFVLSSLASLAHSRFVAGVGVGFLALSGLELILLHRWWQKHLQQLESLPPVQARCPICDDVYTLVIENGVRVLPRTGSHASCPFAGTEVPGAIVSPGQLVS